MQAKHEWRLHMQTLQSLVEAIALTGSGVIGSLWHGGGQRDEASGRQREMVRGGEERCERTG